MFGQRGGNEFKVTLRIKTGEQEIALVNFLNEEYPDLGQEELVRYLNFAKGDGLTWIEKTPDEQIRRANQLNQLDFRNEVTTDPPIEAELKSDLEIPDFLKRLKTQKEKKMVKVKKVKITVNFSDIGDDDQETKDKIFDIMLELGVKSEDARKYLKSGSYQYTNSSMDFYEKVKAAFQDISAVIVTAEEIPLTVQESIEEYFETHKDELKGDKGDDGKTGIGTEGISGADGKNAPWWPLAACIVAVAILLVGSFFAINLWKPVDVEKANAAFNMAGKSFVSQVGNEKLAAVAEIEQAKQTALATIEDMRVGSINLIASGGNDALEAIKKAGSATINPQGQNPQNPQNPLPQNPQTPKTSVTGKTFQQQLDDVMSGK